MPQSAENKPINIHYLRSDTHVVIQFSQPIQNLMLTPEQAKKFQESVGVVVAELERHIAGGNNG